MLTETLIRSRKKKTMRDDNELMRRIGRGDKKAFQILYNRYKRQIFLYCFRFLNDREAAKDTLQEVFVRLYENSKKYNPESNFAAWIHTIARNLCINVQRNSKKYVDFTELRAKEYVDFTELREVDPEAETSNVLLREKLADAVADLPEIFREALILREYGDCSYNQIAKITGQNLATIKYRIFRGRELLRERLGHWLDELNS